MPPVLLHTSNIQLMNSQQAKGILRPLRQQAGFTHAIDPRAIQMVIDATDHLDNSTAEIAFSIITALSDKQPFVPVLVKHASDHMRPRYAKWAYEAMCGAQDFGPFYQVMERGVVSPDIHIARAALSPILKRVHSHKIVDPLLERTLILGLDHSNDRVALDAVTIVMLTSHQQPFVAALQKCANNPGLPQAANQALHQLNKMNGSLSSLHATSFASQAMITKSSPGPDAFIKDVRLNFNIEANDGGPDIESRALMSVLSDAFDKALAAGFVTAKAKVLYAPAGKPVEDSIVNVRFPAGDRDHILHWAAINISPKFDLQKEGDGIYAVTLKERSFL